ncbi:PH and SEC7 domain-containing protein-like [Dendrobates tinctorius]|uniref:PH and SEC7 domain-containing protein-like n=1 Tax=Dendrobates tinctorius TaxID=92724 RepID=UPI003CC97B3B
MNRKLEFHLMEGPLERKPVLQVGGRKASSRTWGTFYAVLVRRTLWVYHDHKYSTKSSESASPLHLTGAVCTPESDYTKRDNCFRLRLMDGSEYLFRAPIPDSLHQWVIKLRHNSGMEASDLLRDAAPASETSSRIMSGSLMPDLCQSIPAQATDLAQVAKPPHWKKTANVTAGGFVMSDDADPENNATTRRRSQSFSSVLYQKVTATLDANDPSSFSVTLFIGDRMPSRGRSHSFAAPPVELLRRNTTDLKSRNKSMLRKLFSNKE